MQQLKILASLAFCLPALASAQTAPPPPKIPPGCDTPQSHQFDFWVGKWEVHPNGADKIIAHSLVEKRYTGCAIRENWMPLGKEVNGGGGSLSLYDARQQRWRQAWVDSTGTRVDLDGGFADGVMSITGLWENFVGPGKDALVRMNYQLQPDGQVRQWGRHRPTKARLGSRRSISSIGGSTRSPVSKLWKRAAFILS